MCRRSTAPLSRVCSGQVILATGLKALQYRCSAALGVSPAFMCMRPELTVLPDHILRDALFRFVARCVTDLGDPFRFQASERSAPLDCCPNSCRAASCSAPSDTATAAAGTPGWCTGNQKRNGIEHLSVLRVTHKPSSAPSLPVRCQLPTTTPIPPVAARTDPGPAPDTPNADRSRRRCCRLFFL